MTLAHWFSEVWDDLLVYLFTLLGVLLSQYIPIFKTGADFDISTNGGRFIIGALVALMLVMKDEDTANVPDKTTVKASKRKNLRRRLGSAMGQGYMYASLTA